MTEEELRKQLESGYEVGAPTGYALSVTGEPYVELSGIGGAEGAKWAFEAYAHGKSGKLYWRKEPEIKTVEAFYMRLLISDKEAK